VLRLAEPEDVPEIARFVNRNRAYHGPWEPPRNEEYYTERHWEAHVARNLGAFQADRALSLYLFSAQDERAVIGRLNFNNFVRGAAHMCHCGYALDEAAQGQGYMTEALRAAIVYVFNDLHIHRIMANYVPRNVRSAALLERLGFEVEGHARSYLLINGQWEDHILTSLVNPEWTPPA
jgi:ribosomal-protein-alanine N-acetyltransferase